VADLHARKLLPDCEARYRWYRRTLPRHVAAALWLDCWDCR
jgi:hypothetical protein